jgi:hypothetical protein
MHRLASSLPVLALFLYACSPSGRPAPEQTLPSHDAPATDTARDAFLANLQRAALREFVAVPGEREFSGRMIARPLQAVALAAVGIDPAEARAIAVREIARFDVQRHIPQTDEFLIGIPAGTENAVARRLMQTLAFEYVEPDWTVFPIGCPNDGLFAQQWHHQANRMNSCAGWDLHTGNPSVSVGICDTGVLTTHEDLQLHRLEGYNAVDQLWESQGGNISPVHPHGTQTTGCAAANGDNGKGVAGVGWNLSHRMMRVSNVSTGSASLSVLQHAARTSVEAGDKVASVSYSGVDTSSNLTTATYIKSIGGLLVWAAGNDNRNLTFGNRDADDIIVAGATDQNDAKASFSAYGTFVDVVAPGVSVTTTSSSSATSYAAVSGTSFACPLTAGMCALIWSRNPALTPNQVEAILKSSTDDLGTAGVDNTFGYGRINTLKSMQNAGGGGSAPVAEFSGTPTSGNAPLLVSFTDLSSNAPTAWSWTFGDGGSSSAQHPSHTYTVAGTYTVTLTASNAFGSDGETKVGYVTVTGGGSEQQIAFDGWESGNYSGGSGWSGAWSVSGDTSILSSSGPHSGTRHVRQRRSTGLLRRSVDLSGVTSAKLVFWARANSFESGDTARVRISGDGGGSFATLKTFADGEDDNVYRRWEFSIPSASNVVVEFDSNMSSSGDQIYYDDIEIRGVR